MALRDLETTSAGVHGIDVFGAERTVADATDHVRHSVSDARRKWDAGVFMDVLATAELTVLILAGAVAKWVYVDLYLGEAWRFTDIVAPLVLLAIIAQISLRQHGLQRAEVLERPGQMLLHTASAIIVSFLMLLAVGVAMKVTEDYSRGWFALWVVLALVSALGVRALATVVARRAQADGRFHERVAVYAPYGVAGLKPASLAASTRAPGSFRTGSTQADETSANWYGQPAANFGLATADAPISDERIRDELQRLVADAQAGSLDTIVIAAPFGSEHMLAETVDVLSVLPARVTIARPTGIGAIPVRAAHSPAGGDMTLLDVQARPLEAHGQWLKTTTDFVGGAMALILFAPVMLACAIAIKLESKGPVFFRQRRHGYNHEIISVWKFRTMTVMEDGESVVQATRGDQRITRVGRILRKTSLDELPQLINVLRGEMSLVGPRPHALAHNALYTRELSRYANRHRVKPGITGWAQIHGFRGPTEDPELMRRRVELDLEYIDTWSLWLDLRIILVTPVLGFVNKNAV